jgi:hypothetical protein
MNTVNHFVSGEGKAGIIFTLGALNAEINSGDEEYVNRVKNYNISYEKYMALKDIVRKIAVSDRFKDVIKTFNVPENETPAGFRIECELEAEGVLAVDLVRDISYDKNGMKRATKVIFSADSANPYEVAAIAPLLGNLTCNPGIIYDLFINNPEANVGNKFKTRDEVMEEIGRILGPGCDISVELNNPFEKDFDEILRECEKFKEMLSEYRLVVKVPHTGPVNADNVHELLESDKKFSLRYDQGTTEDALRGHNLALKLREHGYRVNYTLMFEPYQTAFALQAKPYFINSFIRHRLIQSQKLNEYLEQNKLTGNKKCLEDLRTYMINTDYLNKTETDIELLEVKEYAERILKYRRYHDEEGADGLDGIRHNLRMLKNCNLPDTRLIVCSMEGDFNYPDIDKLTVDPEFADVIDRLVITAEPKYLARFTATNLVVSYQRRFMNAANGEK